MRHWAFSLIRDGDVSVGLRPGRNLGLIIFSWVICLLDCEGQDNSLFSFRSSFWIVLGII